MTHTKHGSCLGTKLFGKVCKKIIQLWNKLLPDWEKIQKFFQKHFSTVAAHRFSRRVGFSFDNSLVSWVLVKLLRSFMSMPFFPSSLSFFKKIENIGLDLSIPLVSLGIGLKQRSSHFFALILPLDYTGIYLRQGIFSENFAQFGSSLVFRQNI